MNKYISPQGQNELIQTMALRVLRDIVANIQHTPFFTIMVDETADISNRDHVVIVLRWIASDLQVYEDFIGLYAADDIKAATLAAIVKDCLHQIKSCNYHNTSSVLRWCFYNVRMKEWVSKIDK